MTIKELIGRFKTINHIARGGQKDVYRAADEKGRQYVIKIINNSADARVIQEIDILKNLSIDNVPTIIDTGTVYDESIDENVMYIIEEYIEGESLRDVLAGGSTFSLSEACELLETLLNIEVVLEENSIIHRDIKPENIIVGNNGKIYLLDFGIAKVIGGSSLTMTSASIGPHTPGYAPQELVYNMKNSQDVRVDLFQIGVTVYEACVGKNPFIANGNRSINRIEYLTKTLVPTPLRLSGDRKGLFSQFVAMLMAKNASSRPNTAKDALRYYYAVKNTLVLGG